MPKRVRASEPPQREQHERADGEQEQIVGRDRAAEEVDRAGESRRARAEQVLGAPERERGIADDQHDAERRGELQQLGRGVDALQQQRLDQRADERDGERGERARAPQKPSGPRPSAPTSVYARYAPSM